MAFKLVILFAALAAANAGFIGAPAAYSYAAPAVAAYAAPAVAVAPAAIGATHQSTVRSYDGLSAISQYSKAVDTPFSSVRKSDVRVTNDAVSVHHAPLVAAAPAAYAYAAPAVAAYHAPAVAAYHAPAVAAYHAPAVAAYHAPAVAAYHAPAVATYAPGATVVAHTSFDGFGVHYVY